MTKGLSKLVNGSLSTCPWRGYSDQVAKDVLEWKSLIGKGSIVAAMAEGIPSHVVEGLLLYEDTVSTVCNNDDEAIRKRSK